MTDDRSLERAARSWIEVGPTRAPDEAVEAALVRIETTPQERDWLPWRFPDMSPILRTAALAVAVIALGATSIALWGGSGIGGPPAATPSPSPSPTAPASVRPTPQPFTGACLLITSDEAAAIAGDIGLGALPSESESESGDVSSCRYTDGGGNIVLRTTLTTPGGAATFATARDVAGVEVIDDLGDAAVYDAATHTLHVLVGDATVSIVASQMGASDAGRRLDAIEIGQLVADRM
jgi:hypothetical protein